MNKALLLCNHKWPFKRQTPSERLQWGNSSFEINSSNKNFDFLVVYDEPLKTINTKLPKSRRILFLSEPSSIKKYTHEYLSQFGIIFTPEHIRGLRNDETKQIISQLALPWHYGVKHSSRFKDYLTYDQLLALPAPKKKNEISTIISSKRMNTHHIQRIETTKLLKERLGNKFHLLGRGYEEIDDKADGIKPYAFHLVCENNDTPNFWTEKLADAYLGWAFPIYSGCKNIGEYFPEESFIKIDLTNQELALKQIESLLNNQDFYQKRLGSIKIAREKVLNEYNLFALIDKTLTNQKWDMKEMLQYPEQIRPQTKQQPLEKRVIKKAKSTYKKAYYRLKNLPFLLPIYFKLINKNPTFFTDYHDRIGKQAIQSGYNGQRGQDWFLDQKIFNGKTNGFFLDIGANDPYELSNTLYFEKKGWNGLAFEPQKRFREAWKKKRRVECLPNLLGANDNEEVTFIEYDTDEWQNALSGVEGYAVETGINIQNIKSKKIQLKKSRLDTILKEKGIKHVDFMSLDVEGFEMEVLQGINFNAVNIDVIVVENDRSHLGDTKLRKFIKSQGYMHIARLSGDDVFKKREG